MDMEQLQCVIAIEQYGTYLEAAFHLNRSQSSVSKSIKRLEEELGTPIFRRTTRRVELTPFGQELVLRGRLILEQYDAIQEKASKVRHQISGQLRIGSITFGRNNRLNPLIAQFIRENPGISIDMHEDMTGPLIQDLRNHKLDVAFVSSMYLQSEPPDNYSTNPDYRSFSCYKDLYYLVVHKDHPLAQREMVHYSDVVGENLFTTERTMDVYHNALRQAFAKHQVPFHVSMYCDSVPSVLYMVSQNLGVSILSSRVVEENENIRLIPIEDSLVRDTQMLILSEDENQQDIRTFYRFIRNHTGV